MCTFYAFYDCNSFKEGLVFLSLLYAASLNVQDELFVARYTNTSVYRYFLNETCAAS